MREGGSGGKESETWRRRVEKKRREGEGEAVCARRVHACMYALMGTCKHTCRWVSSEEFGFVGSCPSNVGTSFVCQVTLLLPTAGKDSSLILGISWGGREGGRELGREGGREDGDREKGAGHGIDTRALPLRPNTHTHVSVSS